MSAIFSCSIDDGHPSDMRAAEILDRHGLNATFFIPGRNQEGDQVLSSTEVRNLDRRFEIGSHTKDHLFLKNLAFQDAQEQVCEGKKRLEDIVGKNVNGFCYPGGKYRPEHVSLVESAGFTYARTVLNLHFDAGQHRFEMPTTIQFFPHKRNLYLRNFIKGGNWGQRQDAVKVALRHDNWLDRLYALFDQSVRDKGVFHLWCHSKDIDRFDIWTEFDRFLAYVAMQVPRKNRLTNEQLAARIR